VPPLVSVEGKLDDAIIRPDGALVTPGALDRAIAAAGPLPRAYQVVQRDATNVELEVIGGSPEAAQAAIAPLLEGLTITARPATAIAVEPNGKYRISRRVAPLTGYELFEGVEG
jgi:hypothetical protein